MQSVRFRMLAAAVLVLATAQTAAGARRPVTIVVRPSGEFVMNYCTTLCAPHYKLWNLKASCGPRSCVCGCVAPNTTWPPARFYQVY
jgi:hypothetical protein